MEAQTPVQVNKRKVGKTDIKPNKMPYKVIKTLDTTQTYTRMQERSFPSSSAAVTL